MPEEYPAKEDIDNLANLFDMAQEDFEDDWDAVAGFILSKFYLISRGDNDPIQAARMYQRTTSESLRNVK